MAQDAHRVDTPVDALLHRGSERILLAGELFFREGDERNAIYRVERGAICTYQVPREGRQSFAEFVRKGDWFGFGYLDRHTCRARAVVTTLVSCFPLSSVDDLIERNPRVKSRMADAVEREFEFVRHNILGRPPSPVERVAAYLLSLVSINRNEGRDASIIVESMSCGLIAETLTMSVDTLAAVLVEFGERGFVEPWADGRLRIKDMAALETIASHRIQWTPPAWESA